MMIEPQPEEIKNPRGLIHIATVKRTGPFSSGRGAPDAYRPRTSPGVYIPTSKHDHKPAGINPVA